MSKVCKGPGVRAWAGSWGGGMWGAQCAGPPGGSEEKPAGAWAFTCLSPLSAPLPALGLRGRLGGLAAATLADSLVWSALAAAAGPAASSAARC
jgi:hypothetical protein